MKELHLLKKTKVEELGNYYITDYGKLCYYDKQGKWFYCKKVDRKPGWVWIYLSGNKREFNEVNLALKYYKDGKIVKPKKKENIKTNDDIFTLPRETDKRYKEGVDVGAMSHLIIPLPLKESVSTQKTTNDYPKQYERLNNARKLKNKSKLKPPKY